MSLINGGKKMNRQKPATIGCIVLSIAFSVSFGLFIYFNQFLPFVQNTYEKLLYYSEDLYQEYQKEAERMIATHDYTSQYLAKATFYSEDNQTTLVIEIGDYNDDSGYSDYLTAVVKNFGTDKQEVTFKRHRSAEKAPKDAKMYKTITNIITAIFVFIIVRFTKHLIRISIKKCYKNVILIILFCTIFTAIAIPMIHFLAT